MQQKYLGPVPITGDIATAMAEIKETLFNGKKAYKAIFKGKGRE